jgi:integrase
MSRAQVSFWIFRTKKKDGTFHPRFRFRYIGPDGKPKVGTGFTDKNETRRLALQLVLEADEIRRGIRKPPQPSDTEGLKPIRKHIEAYLAWGKIQGGKRGRPWASRYGQLKDAALTWWVETLGLSNLADVSLPSVEAALQRKASNDRVTGRTLANTAMALAAFLRWCVERKYLPSYPLEGLRGFDISVSPKNFRRAFTLEEIGKLLASAPPRNRVVYRLALITGFRAGEIASLCVGHLDLEKKTLQLPAEAAKNRLEAFCALPQDLIHDLAPFLQGRPPHVKLFRHFNPNHAGRRLNLDLRRAGIEKRTFGGKVDFHALRTAHINLGIELGFDIKTAQTLARHQTPYLTLNTYGRANAERLRNAVELIGQTIQNAEAKRVSQKEVNRDALALAAGAENLTQPSGQEQDSDSPSECATSASNPVAPTISPVATSPRQDAPMRNSHAGSFRPFDIRRKRCLGGRR